MFLRLRRVFLRKDAPSPRAFRCVFQLKITSDSEPSFPLHSRRCFNALPRTAIPVLPHGHMSQVGDSVTRPSSPSASYGPTRSTRIRIAERSCNGICRCSSVSSTAAQQRHAVWVPTAGNTRREASDAGILSVWVGVWGVQGASVLPQ